MTGADSALRPDELERLHAFRRAAADVHSASIMRAGGSVGFHLSVRSGGSERVTPKAYDQERFRSFAIAVRRAYGSDQANFLAALNVLSRLEPALRERLTQIRADYLEALKSEDMQLNGLTHEEVFKAWLYGSVFHDDDQEQRRRWNSLNATSLRAAAASFLVEVTALRLAHAILALDNMIADYLQEHRLAEISPATEYVAEAAPRSRSRVEASLRHHHQHGVLWLDITNAGDAPAFDLSLEEIRAVRGGTDDILVHGEAEKLPRERLRPRERVSLAAALDRDSPSEVEVFVAWSDEHGERQRDSFRLDLLAV